MRPHAGSPNANLVAGMAWLQSTHTIRLNHRHRRQVSRHHFGELRLERSQAKAERIISEELVRLGWQWAELASRRKRDPAKLEIAARLRRETTLSVKHIATRVHLGTPESASARLLTATREKASADPAQRTLGI
ncbi:MAG: hypothetical protein NT154_09205 [Verrucomicrobia bacterium]|nr:hypothetical protein [Verrucomicrobiota bacterium]